MDPDVRSDFSSKLFASRIRGCLEAADETATNDGKRINSVSKTVHCPIVVVQFERANIYCEHHRLQRYDICRIYCPPCHYWRLDHTRFGSTSHRRIASTIHLQFAIDAAPAHLIENLIKRASGMNYYTYVIRGNDSRE